MLADDDESKFVPASPIESPLCLLLAIAGGARYARIEHVGDGVS